MGKKLFKNVGNDIKTIAEEIAGIFFLLYFLFGIVIIVGGCALISEMPVFGFIAILIGLAIFGFGYIISKLAVILLYAYGEITDSLISIDSKMPNTANSEKNEQINVTAKKSPVSNTAHSANLKAHILSWLSNDQDADKAIFFCTKCKSTYSEDTGSRNYCPDCRVSLIETQYTRDYWRSLSEAEKNEARKKLAQEL